MTLDSATITGATVPLTIGVTITGAKIAEVGGGTIGERIAQTIGGPTVCAVARKKKTSPKRKKMRPRTTSTVMIAE